MISGSLTNLARILSATLVGPDPGFTGVSTDSRTLQPGELFVALRGPNFDGHAFVAEAARRGAAAAVVEQPGDGSLPWLRVDDSLAALGAIAADWRSRFELPVLAVTGSFGKTTVKEMMAAIAATRGEVLATRGNLNNEIGLPLTLFRLGRSTAWRCSNSARTTSARSPAGRHRRPSVGRGDGGGAGAPRGLRLDRGRGARQGRDVCRAAGTARR
jgi:UDP-N-acetylmuramoyl-tripeptide--D-alanyl-D-alanine ligase